MFDKKTRIEPLQVLTLDEAKDQLNIVDFNDDDDLILRLISVAGDMAERHTGYLFNQCNVSLQFEACYTKVLLRYPPIISVESVQVDDVDIPFMFNSFAGQITPDVSGLSQNDLIVVNYTAGYDEVPEIVKQACAVILSDLYNNRDSHVDAKMTPTMFNALKLLNI